MHYLFRSALYSIQYIHLYGFIKISIDDEVCQYRLVIVTSFTFRNEAADILQGSVSGKFAETNFTSKARS